MGHLKEILSSKNITDETKNSLIVSLVDEIKKYDPSIKDKVEDELVGLSKYKFYISEEECVEIYNMYKEKYKDSSLYTINEIEQVLQNNNLPNDKADYFNKYALVSVIYSYLFENGKYITQISQYLSKNKIIVCYNLSVEKIQSLINEGNDNAYFKQVIYR